MLMLPPIVLCRRSRMPATPSLRSSELGSSRWRRENDRSWSVSLAPRSAASACSRAAAPACRRRRLRSAPFEKADIAEHDGEQIVEVMRDAGGELADGLQPLHLAQASIPRARAPRSAQQLAVGAASSAVRSCTREFRCSLSAAALVLPSAAAQAGPHHAHQRGRMERAFQKADVAERVGQPGGRGIALQPAAVLGQQDERENRTRAAASRPNPPAPACRRRGSLPR